MLDVLIQKLKDAKHVKVSQLEIDTEINKLVSDTGESAGTQKMQNEIPESQIKTAQLISDKVDAAPIPYSQKVDLAHRQIYDLVDEYEEIRQREPGGSRRTRMMNEVAAKMRALAFVTYPLLPALMAGKRAGERLAAICTLQVRPELGHFYWLVERIMEEEQPFIFFHASLAVLELVKTHSFISRETIEPAILKALERIQDFRGGRPDQNTVDVLNEILKRLQGQNREM